MNNDEKAWVRDRFLRAVSRLEPISGLSDGDKQHVLDRILEIEGDSIGRLLRQEFDAEEVAGMHIDDLVERINSKIDKEGEGYSLKHAEEYLRSRELERSMLRLLGRIRKLGPDQTEEAEELEGELMELLGLMKEEKPELLERYSGRLSESIGDLVAITSHGTMGSHRKLEELQASGALERMRKEMASKGRSKKAKRKG